MPFMFMKSAPQNGAELLNGNARPKKACKQSRKAINQYTKLGRRIGNRISKL